MTKKNVYSVVPEFYCAYSQTPLTKKEKRKIFFCKIKEVIREALWHLLHAIAISLQVVGVAWLAGIFFKIGAS